MEKKNLTFEKALMFLRSWNPVCFSSLMNKSVVLVVPMLSSLDVTRLSRYGNWYVTADSEMNVHVVIKNCL